jgi:predicted component of type VI protein secretion system
MGKWVFLDDEREIKIGYDIRTYTAEETIELIKNDSVVADTRNTPL